VTVSLQEPSDKLAANVRVEFRRPPVAESGRSHSEVPSFSLYCDKRGRTVGIHTSTIGPNHGGRSGSDGHLKLEQMNAGELQARLLKYFTTLMQDSRPHGEL
jgi:hypothetical protein